MGRGHGVGVVKRSDEPLRHIMRTNLPWRPATKTVCGKPASQYAHGLVLSLAEARTMVRDLGKQRAALMLCMTCASHAERWAEWDVSPLARMEREVAGGAFGAPDPLVAAELRAFAMLVERHADEFAELVDSFVRGDVVPMSELRRQRAMRQS